MPPHPPSEAHLLKFRDLIVCPIQTFWGTHERVDSEHRAPLKS